MKQHFLWQVQCQKDYDINFWGLKGKAQRCWPLSLATATAWLFTLTSERGVGHVVNMDTQ